MAASKQKNVRFYRIKNEIRILGLDDAPFKRTDKDVIVVGVVMRGGSYVDGILSTRVGVDGLDATEKIVSLIRGCKFKDLRVVMLDGLGFGGFNLVDIKKVFQETNLPVIVSVRKMPDFEEIKKALKLNLSHFTRRWGCVKKAGKPRKVEFPAKPGKYAYIQTSGLRIKDAEEIVRLSTTRSLVPEPLRLAHLIASGIVLGESRGRA